MVRTDEVRGMAIWHRWILAAFYVMVACFAGAIGVFSLLVSQLENIRHGQTYIDALKNGRRMASSESMFGTLAHRFGGRNLILLLFPIPRKDDYGDLDKVT